MERLHKPRGSSLSERAYQQIKEDITNGKLRPGDILREERLSEEIAISRTPIRAALQRLVYEGLAQIMENRSICVTNVTEKDIQELTQVRRELEMLVIRLLKTSAKEEEIARLRQFCQQEQATLAQAPVDHLRLIQLDYELHVTLAELTGNRFLWETMKRIKTHARRFLVLSGTMHKYGAAGVREHEEIVHFLEQGKFDYAELAIRDHVIKIGDRIFV